LSEIKLGVFNCTGKTHSVDKAGLEKWKVRFEDEYGNRIVIDTDESNFNRFDIQDQFPWSLVRRQTTL
jgi:hypothetical protein